MRGPFSIVPLAKSDRLSAMSRFFAAAVLLAAAIVLGGGGSSAPAAETALQLTFAAVLAALALSARSIGFGKLPRSAWLIAILVLALPVLHLVPLPPALWHDLPGREPIIAALGLVDSSESWRPLSLTPSRTLAALLAMIAPTALYLIVAGLDEQARQQLLLVVAGGAVATALLGTMQVAAGESGAWRLYPETHMLYLTGFFANRNATADLLLIGLLALAAWWAGTPREQSSPLIRLLIPALAALLLLALVLTGSRMGISLFLPTAMLMLIILWPAPARNGRRALALGGLVALAGLGAILATRIPALQPVVTRFLRDGDGRWKLWEDTSHAISQYWPVGSGIGSFQPVFIANERLEFVDPSSPVRAHNDWLEFTLEAGLAGWIVLVLVGLLLLAQAWRTLRQARQAMAQPTTRLAGGLLRAHALFGIGSLSILATHAIVDYPLRTMTLACLCAVAAAMLLTMPAKIAGQMN